MILALLVALFLAYPAKMAPGMTGSVRHDLSVVLYPDEGRLRAVDTITLLPGDGPLPKFSLSGNSRVTSVSVDGREAGEVEISLPFGADLVQHTGVLHAGVVTALVDTACGYAAYTMMAEHEEVLSVEFKMNFLRPASGERFVAVGRVVKAGSTIIATQGDVFAQAGAVRDHVAMMVALIAFTFVKKEMRDFASMYCMKHEILHHDILGPLIFNLPAF